MYAKAALRQSARLRPDGLICGGRALRALAGAVALSAGARPGEPVIGESRAHASVA